MTNKPLTPSELKRMDGEPIWVMPLVGDEKPHWEICTYNLYDLDLYGMAWVAYKDKLGG